MRLLFAVLITATLALAGWALWGEPPAVESRRPAAGGSLQLWQEVSRTGAANDCFQLGPLFDAAVAAQLERVLSSQGLATELLWREQERQVGYWVFLPDAGSVQEAQRLIDELARLGVEDAVLVVDAERPNVVSLGTYAEHGAAQARQEQLQALGFEPELAPRHAKRAAAMIHLQLGDGELPQAPADHRWQRIACTTP